MNVLSQRELFCSHNGQTRVFTPRRVPRLTTGMRRVMAAILVKEMLLDRRQMALSNLLRRKVDTRTLRRLIALGCVEVSPGMPATYIVTRLGHIARKMYTRGGIE